MIFTFQTHNAICIVYCYSKMDQCQISNAIQHLLFFNRLLPFILTLLSSLTVLKIWGRFYVPLGILHYVTILFS